MKLHSVSVKGISSEEFSMLVSQELITTHCFTERGKMIKSCDA